MRTSSSEVFAANDGAPAGREDTWRAFLSNPDIAIGVVRYGSDGQLRFVENNEASQMFARVPWQEVPGKTTHEAMIPEVAEFFDAKIRQCIRDGNAQNYERAVDLPSGRVAWAANLLPVKAPDGRVREVVAMARPIPPEMHSTGIHQRNQALVEGLSSTTPGLIYLYDPRARRANFVCGQVESLLGYKPYEIEEMFDPLVQLIHPDDLGRVATHIAEVVANPCEKVSIFECRVQHRNGEYRPLLCHNRVLDRNADGTARTLIGVANDVSDQELLKNEVESLTNRLSTAQMDERRVIAQELHDSAGQYMVAAELALLGAQELAPDLAKNKLLSGALGDVMECLKDAEREIRVVSYLLHPPAIGNQGLSTVLRNFALGFGGRAGVAVDVAIDKAINRAPEHLAIPLLRIFQEALTNVHRHAKANNVLVKVEVRSDDIELTIADDGVGFDASSAASRTGWGIGLGGMSERLERLGGRLEIQSDKGTQLVATLPLARPDQP